MRGSTWRILPADPLQAATLARRCGMDALIGQLLLNRGIRHAAEAQQFFAPRLASLNDPFQLPHMNTAVWRIRCAVDRKEPIVVFGDSDVDGVTAAAIVAEVITALGGLVTARLSDRLADGYGIPEHLIARLMRDQVKLLVAVDCGTNQPGIIRQLSEAGIETLILDHHVPITQPAKPLAFVNPKFHNTSGQELCSAGLAFKLAQALSQDAPDRLRGVSDLAMLGTLADYAPLIGDNRVMIAAGLEQLLTGQRPGLKVLCESVQLNTPTPEQILRRLIPRLNAPGRLGKAHLLWRALVAPSSVRAKRYAELLGAAHAQTKTLHRQILLEAQEQASRIHLKDHYVMVVGRNGWHPGVMGPIAAQLVDTYARPAIAIAFEDDTGIGSGRSIAAFDLFQALRACEGVLMRYGGHPQACGLTLARTHLETFRDRINQHAHGFLQRQELSRTLTIDAEVEAGWLTQRVAQTIQQFAPFGSGNSRPLFVLRNLLVQRQDAKTAWMTDGASRLRLRSRAMDIVPGERYDVVGGLELVGEEPAFSVSDARLS